MSSPLITDDDVNLALSHFSGGNHLRANDIEGHMRAALEAVAPEIVNRCCNVVAAYEKELRALPSYGAPGWMSALLNARARMLALVWRDEA